MLKSRVMVMRRRQVQQQGELWFSTDRFSEKQDEEKPRADENQKQEPETGKSQSEG